jgi:hypothetical protein
VPKPIQSHVRAILAKNGRDIKLNEAMRFGWDSRKACPGHASWKRKGTRASVVWEGAVRKARELLSDDGVRIIEHFDTVSFIFDDTVLLRIKKASVALRTSNYPTSLAELFDQHDEDLFGWEGLQRVEAVYVLDRFETTVLWIGIVASDQNAELWHFELADEPIVAGKIEPKPKKESTSGLVRLKGDVEKDAKLRTLRRGKPAKEPEDGE